MDRSRLAGAYERDIAAVLASRRRYDDLNVREQAIVRAEWAERMDALRRGLDLATEFTDQGRGWVELDDEGKVVHHGGAAGSVAGDVADSAS